MRAILLKVSQHFQHPSLADEGWEKFFSKVSIFLSRSVKNRLKAVPRLEIGRTGTKLFAITKKEECSSSALSLPFLWSFATQGMHVFNNR